MQPEQQSALLFQILFQPQFNFLRAEHVNQEVENNIFELMKIGLKYFTSQRTTFLPIAITNIFVSGLLPVVYGLCYVLWQIILRHSIMTGWGLESV